MPVDFGEEDFEFTLVDRLHVIREIDKKYDLLDKSYLSFSGGKDSTVLSCLLDMALPGNLIPRVFIDTGIEYNAIREFVNDLASIDGRFQIIKPYKPIKRLLDEKGYPFKSKEHSMKVGQYQNGSRAKSIMVYKDGNGRFSCPKMLLYQFDESFKLKLSSECCMYLKKKPALKWQKVNNRSIGIIGLRMEEGGQRKNNKGCIIVKGRKLTRFKPLNPVSDAFENWFIRKYEIKLCKLYYPPYDFKRTGCKGCPFSLDLQEQLSVMEKYLPNERKQCEAIWEPVYQEYRRIGFRLLKNEQMKLF